ncbi:cob(I)yrinic acid a,c-diamide adenosyltransferase [Virgibacillus sp. W0430]|uniref:cob(I)yrinic acid a,c-diamide adenosyltransferase n=1 Tax=Virgibacillus sp. W0430 TaxID=3391580 RepID=UPI003F45B103
MRIYTRTGDSGMTSLVYGGRIPKNDTRVDAYGTCDEANSMIGLALSYLRNEEWVGREQFNQSIQRVQTILFHVGSELATPSEREVAWKLKEKHIKELEHQIDEWESVLPTLENFILPSGHPAANAFHVARTIIRRAERLAVGLDGMTLNPFVLAYLNRLSDYLFVAARFINYTLEVEEINLQVDDTTS